MVQVPASLSHVKFINIVCDSYLLRRDLVDLYGKFWVVNFGLIFYHIGLDHLRWAFVSIFVLLGTFVSVKSMHKTLNWTSSRDIIIKLWR